MGGRPPRSNEDIANSAARYRTRVDFSRGDAGGYTLAKKRRIIDDICAHMEPGGVIWTKERCLEEAQKYSDRWALGRANKACYNRIHQMGWQAEAFAHMQRPRNARISKTDCIEEARKYRTPGEFLRGSKAHYNAALRHRWKEAFAHLHYARQYYDEENASALAAECRTRKEFQDRYQAAYNWARRKGLIDKLCAHMEKPGNVYLRSVYEIRNDATHEIYVGISCDVERRYRDHAETGIPQVRDAIKRGAELRIVSELLPAHEAGRIEAASISEYRSKGWNILNIQEGGGLGAPYRRITTEEIVAAAKACKTRNEFREKYNSLAQAADRWDLTSELFRDHENNGYASAGSARAAASSRERAIGKRDLSKEFCMAIARQHRSPSALHAADQSVYAKILREGWKEDAFAHMDGQG
jgi:predicted GIY-YIG superfamily endonuclease